MSMALMAKLAMPPLPYHQERSRIACHSRSVSRGSWPFSSGARPASTITLVASAASGNWQMHSPQPTSPPLAVSFTMVT